MKKVELEEKLRETNIRLSEQEAENRTLINEKAQWRRDSTDLAALRVANRTLAIKMAEEETVREHLSGWLGASMDQGNYFVRAFETIRDYRGLSVETPRRIALAILAEFQETDEAVA